MKLIKHFDFTKMSALDEKDWNIEVGEKWANNEIQQYVHESDNLYFDDGLIIKATKTGDIIKSARINTKNKFYFKYGKVDIIAKVPSGKGTWPALWMMPQDSTYGRWPKSGEIDIMEHTGNQPGKVYCCLHTEKYNHRMDNEYFLTHTQADVPDQFHMYSILWDAEKIVYFIDGKEVGSHRRGEESKDRSHHGWPFDQPFYIIMNMAIGGSLGGKVDLNCFPQTLVIKDIKVYQKDDATS